LLFLAIVVGAVAGATSLHWGYIKNFALALGVPPTSQESKPSAVNTAIAPPASAPPAARSQPVIAAPTKPLTPQEPKFDLTSNMDVHTGDYTVSLVSAEYSQNLAPLHAKRKQFTSGTFLVLSVYVRNDKSVPMRWPTLVLMDRERSVYSRRTPSLEVSNEVLGWESINPGTTVGGIMVFDVPSKQEYILCVGLDQSTNSIFGHSIKARETKN